MILCEKVVEIGMKYYRKWFFRMFFLLCSFRRKGNEREWDIKDLFNEALGFQEGEVAFDDMKMDIDAFRNLILSDLGDYMDNGEVREKLLGHLLPSPSGDLYNVRYDEDLMRYVSVDK